MRATQQGGGKGLDNGRFVTMVGSIMKHVLAALFFPQALSPPVRVVLLALCVSASLYVWPPYLWHMLVETARCACLVFLALLATTIASPRSRSLRSCTMRLLVALGVWAHEWRRVVWCAWTALWFRAAAPPPSPQPMVDDDDEKDDCDSSDAEPGPCVVTQKE